MSALLALGAVVLGGCQVPSFGAFPGATTQGRTEFHLWQGFVVAGLIVTAFVGGLIIYAVVRYRRRGPDEMPRQFHEHIPLEITYTIIPFVIIGALFWVTVIAENKINAVSDHPNEIIHVLAYRWGWRFSYNDGAGHSQNVVIQTSAQPTLLAQPALSKEYPTLVLPVDATVRINLSSADVIHGFYIPAFNFSRYAQPGVPGSQQQFDFSTTTIGLFRGQCTQYCGLYHSEMLFSVHVETAANFDHWLSAQQAKQAASGLGASS